ncbi:ThiF family adenylyltransferase [Bradyrhizobium brasilense]|uniref:ThiF family adenylyltransferase n=1 Tax=Bradyrhizobium brasilense TaxID=1419277 RepID=UPI00287803D4|nr:ThiF family adenylyltransferase [Bradyrhizobium brasilense]MCP3414254.1 ThiF family adenylyltransferase [Bradyrhizobium brasilense]
MAELHSASQPKEDEEKLSPTIRSAIADLRVKFAAQDPPVLHWNANYVAVPITVDVELPSRGPVGGVDIRKREPIILLFNRKSFPYFAPYVYSDRTDFSKTAFPHVNVTGPGTPAWFCLHRGSIDTWFAEHTVVDLVERARGWLRDAARNRLVPEGDGFEPTRAVDTLGTFYYPPGDNLGRILEHWKIHGGAAGHVVTSFDLLDDESMAEIGTTGYAVRQDAFVSPESYADQKSLAFAINVLQEKPEFKSLFQRRLFGVLVWADESTVSRTHFGELPQTLGELETWARDLGLPLTQALDDYLTHELHILAGVPIVLAVRRPQQVLGTESDVELLNFLVSAGGDNCPKDGAWNPAATVFLSDHRTPLTPDFARQISALPADGAAQPTVIFGAGALGSKVSTHLARSGSVALKIVDSATISPHNLVRHALGGRAIGLAKAEALKDELIRLYPGQRDLPIEAVKGSALFRLREEGFFDGYANLVDMTASNIVFNALRDADIPPTVRVHRAEIAHRGRLGLLSVEGRDRNPRIDDLQTLIYDSAIEDDAVAAWLEEVKATRDDRVGSGGLEDIQVGLSCSSATMRLADEVVSFHAAAVTRRLRPYLAKDGPSRTDGAVYRCFLGDDGDSRASTRTFAPTVVLEADAGWQIRIAAGAVETMSTLLRKHSPTETGGILVGRIAAPRKTIYVTRLVPAPPDSRGTPWVFTRGTEKLPEALEHVRRRTGGLLTYVGEWHTHPMGGSDLSDTDKGAVISLRSILDHVGLPTLVTIVTPDEIRPHLFEPTSPPIVVDPPRRRFGIIRVILGWR